MSFMLSPKATVSFKEGSSPKYSAKSRSHRLGMALFDDVCAVLPCKQREAQSWKIPFDLSGLFFVSDKCQSPYLHILKSCPGIAKASAGNTPVKPIAFFHHFRMDIEIVIFDGYAYGKALSVTVGQQFL